MTKCVQRTFWVDTEEGIAEAERYKLSLEDGCYSVTCRPVGLWRTTIIGRHEMRVGEQTMLVDPSMLA